jgi:ribosome modulation factor
MNDEAARQGRPDEPIHLRRQCSPPYARRVVVNRDALGAVEIAAISVEGAVDRFVGRPRSRCPYSLQSARALAECWLLGWDEANGLLEIRGQEEAARWLRGTA